MATAHSDVDIVPYLRGELGESERAAIEAHLVGCAACRDTVAAFRTLLSQLEASRPDPPDLHWGRWHGDLERKLDDRLRSPAERPAWRLVPLALSAALAGLLMYITVLGGREEGRVAELGREPRLRDLGALEETMVGQRLDLLEQYPVVEKLDLLEELDLIDNLDRLRDVRHGEAPTSHTET
jgi:predicted anti-sigma-YlaC factor YlaD